MIRLPKNATRRTLTGCFLAVLTYVSVIGCGGESSDSTIVRTITVSAAASTSQVMEAIAAQFERETGIAVETNFASSGSLVQQMQYGNMADIFISASSQWMDTACADSLVDASTRIDLLGNRLVLVTAVDDSSAISFEESDWVKRLDGVIAMGDPAHVPAGVYGREAFEYYGVYDDLAGRLSNSASVTAAMMLVETGQTHYGVVYENNAIMSDKVRIIARFPDNSHSPIVYPAVLGNDLSLEAEQFFSFLRGPFAHALFEEYGFVPLTDIVMPAVEAVSGGYGFSGGDLSPTFVAMMLSLKVALASVLLLIVPAVGFGWLLAKREFRGKHVLSALLQVPLVIPPVATGYLLLVTLGAGSPVGSWIEHTTGFSLSFNWIAVVIATSVVSMPLLVKAIRVAMENVDSRVEDAARTLGKSPIATFFHVTLPLSWHGIVAGGILAFSRAMGEFGATITYAGNIAGKTRTIPLATYNFIQSPGGEQQAMILITVSVVVSVASIAIVEWLSSRRRYSW